MSCSLETSSELRVASRVLVGLVVVVVGLDGGRKWLADEQCSYVLPCTFLISSDLCSNFNESF